MSVYLIDYENVHYAGLSGIEELRPSDEVVLFYGNSASTIPMELHIGIANSGAKVQYIRISKTAKNYLDFQLSSMAGYLVGTTRQEDFIIVSNDTGFESVLDLWNGQTFAGRKISFSRRDQITLKKAGKKSKNKGNSKKGTEAGKQAEGKALKKAKSAKSKKAKAKAAESVADDSLQTQSGGMDLPALQEAKPQQAGTAGTAFSMPQESRVREEVPEKVIARTRKQANARMDKIPEAQKKKIRLAVKELGLKPTDYTKVYKAYQASEDKQAYNQGLVKALKQEKGNQVYKATVGLLY